MANLLGPLAEQLTVEQFNKRTRQFNGFPGHGVVLYLDEAKTTPATVLAYDPETPTTPGSAIPNSKVNLDNQSRLPLFWFPNGVTTLYAAVNRGPTVQLTARTADRNQAGDWVPADHGLITWTDDPARAGGGTGALTAARLYLARLHVPSSAGAITNIEMEVLTAGSGLTGGYAALFTAARARIATTADQATAWGTTGSKTMALVGGPYTGLGGADVYVGFWHVGTTGPSFARVQAPAATLTNYKLSLNNSRYGQGDDSLVATAPNPFTMASAWATAVWVGLS